MTGKGKDCGFYEARRRFAGGAAKPNGQAGALVHDVNLVSGRIDVAMQARMLRVLLAGLEREARTTITVARLLIKQY